MKKYDIVFETISVATVKANCKLPPQEITAFVTEPDKVNKDTGAMLFTHGWDCNRFMDQELMEYAADAYNVVCVSAEFRQSGYAFNARTGEGFSAPYDLSFYQVFDSAGALRHILSLKSTLNRKRIFAYGLSQGGHRALLLSIFAPNTFAFVNAAAPLTRPLELLQMLTGREFSEDELSISHVVEHADLITCPVYLEHGTADETLPHTEHTVILEKRLKELGKAHTVVYHKGGVHCPPGPVRLQAFKNTVGANIGKLTLKDDDDFLKGRIVKIPCANKTLVIDWSKPQNSTELFCWETKA